MVADISMVGDTFNAQLAPASLPISKREVSYRSMGAPKNGGPSALGRPGSVAV